LAGKLPQKYHELLSIIISQVNWLNRLISDLLDLDHIEQNKLKLNLEYRDLNQIVSVTVDAVKETMILKNQTYQLDIFSDVIPVLVDIDRIQQILFNIIGNAIKYTPKSGHITVNTSITDDFGIIQVNDTGVGMSKEELEHSFELYYRSDEAKKGSTQGHGLGLFIVKSLVDAHSRTINISSEPGVGTNIKVYLPISLHQPDILLD